MKATFDVTVKINGTKFVENRSNPRKYSKICTNLRFCAENMQFYDFLAFV
jgi:hypothetical protein